ncbi:collagen, type I, alpha 1a-like [Odocoileus virginianus]|uniref:Collagen, type I, alpha 1a-like n=1 Tax=Odocoileus virginianus TaxID=9874 RepID=A0ABM4HWC8_ODOVR
MQEGSTGPSGEERRFGEEGAFRGAGGIPGRRERYGEQGIPFLAPAVSSCSGTRRTRQALWRVCGNGGVWGNVGVQGAEVDNDNQVPGPRSRSQLTSVQTPDLPLGATGTQPVCALRGAAGIWGTAEAVGKPGHRPAQGRRPYALTASLQTSQLKPGGRWHCEDCGDPLAPDPGGRLPLSTLDSHLISNRTPKPGHEQTAPAVQHDGGLGEDECLCFEAPSLVLRDSGRWKPLQSRFPRLRSRAINQSRARGPVRGHRPPPAAPPVESGNTRNACTAGKRLNQPRRSHTAKRLRHWKKKRTFSEVVFVARRLLITQFNWKKKILAVKASAVALCPQHPAGQGDDVPSLRALSGRRTRVLLPTQQTPQGRGPSARPRPPTCPGPGARAREPRAGLPAPLHLSPPGQGPQPSPAAADACPGFWEALGVRPGCGGRREAAVGPAPADAGGRAPRVPDPAGQTAASVNAASVPGGGDVCPPGESARPPGAPRPLERDHGIRPPGTRPRAALPCLLSSAAGGASRGPAAGPTSAGSWAVGCPWSPPGARQLRGPPGALDPLLGGRSGAFCVFILVAGAACGHIAAPREGYFEAPSPPQARVPTEMPAPAVTVYSAGPWPAAARPAPAPADLLFLARVSRQPHKHGSRDSCGPGTRPRGLRCRDPVSLPPLRGRAGPRAPGAPAPGSHPPPAPGPAQGRLHVPTEPDPDDEGGYVTATPGVDPFPPSRGGLRSPRG